MAASWTGLEGVLRIPPLASSLADPNGHLSLGQHSPGAPTHKMRWPDETACGISTTYQSGAAAWTFFRGTEKNVTCRRRGCAS